MDIYKKRIKKYKKRVKMALLVLYSVKKVNEGIGVWLHFGYSLNEEAATSFLSRVILRPYRFDSGLRHDLKDFKFSVSESLEFFLYNICTNYDNLLTIS